MERPTEPEHRSGLFEASAPEPRGYLAAATVLAAHLAGCDGETNGEEAEGFERLFRLGPTERARYTALFAQYRCDPGAYRPIATQLVHTQGRGSAALEDLLERLYHLALVDGSLTSAECAFLEELCGVFGLPGYWRRLDAQQARQDDPYRVLGIHRDATDQEVRAAFRRLTRQHHPDAVVARGEVVTDTSPMANINAAYRRVMRARRRKG